MPHSRRLSNGFAPCRLEWRPSRLLCGCLLASTCLAAVACFRSGLATPVAGSLSALAIAYGFHAALREWRRPVVEIVIGEDAIVRVDGEPVEGFRAAWRGPLVVARWRDTAGGVEHKAWLPDTMAEEARRELRLALIRADPARNPGSVAP